MIPDIIRTKDTPELKLSRSIYSCGHCNLDIPSDGDNFLKVKDKYDWVQKHPFVFKDVRYNTQTRGGVAILNSTKQCPYCFNKYDTAHWTRFGKILVVLWF